MPFKTQPVDSSMFDEVGYDNETKELKVRFKSGKEHIYEGIDETTYNELLKSKSRGRFFGQNIRNNYKFHLGGKENE